MSIFRKNRTQPEGEKAFSAQACDYRSLLEDVLRRPYEIDSNLCGFTVDIVVPVHNDPAGDLKTLLQGLSRTSLPYRLIFVDDDSSLKETLTALDEAAQQSPQVRVIRNERSIGLMKSINRGLVLAQSVTVVLTSHAILPKMWLERLVSPIIKDPTVCSATPFSNHSYVCAFPKPYTDSREFSARSEEEIDAFFQEIRCLYTTIPGGDHLCMAFSKEAMKKVGIFNQKYEDDPRLCLMEWCFRASRAGYRNVCVENLFVRHTSVPLELSATRRKEWHAGLSELNGAFPAQYARYQAFEAQDALRPIRSYVSMRIGSRFSSERKLIFTGPDGQAYYRMLFEKASSEETLIALVSFQTDARKYGVRCQYGSLVSDFVMRDLGAVFHFADQMQMNMVLVGDLRTYPDPFEHLLSIRQYAEHSGARLVYLVLNYYCLCSTARLLKDGRHYCEVPQEAECERCIRHMEAFSKGMVPSVKAWREHFAVFLHACQEIRVFSEDSVRLLNKVYGNLDQIHVFSYPVPHFSPVTRRAKSTTDLQIGVIGDLSLSNAIGTIHNMSVICREKKLPVRFTVFGPIPDKLLSRHLSSTGTLNYADFPRALLDNDTDLLFIASRYPRTAAPEAHDAVNLGIPAASFSYGAQAEVLRRYEKSFLMDDLSDENKLGALIDFVTAHQAPVPSDLRPILFVTKDHSVFCKFRVDNLREQLLSYGVPSQVMAPSQVKKKIVSSCRAVVLFRCGKSPAVHHVLELSRKTSVPAFLSICGDNEISRYADFKNLLSGCLISDESLREAVVSHGFSDKIFLQPLVYSLSMKTLADEALCRVKKDRKRFTIGYIGIGSAAQENLDRIAPDLARLLAEADSSVFLRLMGPLSVPECLEPFEDDLELVSYDSPDEWPEFLARADLFVLPETSREKSGRVLTGMLGLMSGLVGTACLCENNAAPYLVESGGAWYNAMRSLWKDKDYCDQLGQKARTLVLSGYGSDQLPPELQILWHIQGESST